MTMADIMLKMQIHLFLYQNEEQFIKARKKTKKNLDSIISLK